MTMQPRMIRSDGAAMDRALDAGDGIVRLAPAWVPRLFCTPGRRIRLHPDDYFAFGAGRGGIDERWLASTVRAENGPLTGPYEGLSLVAEPDGGLLPFDEFVAHHGPALIGDRLTEQHGGWTMYSKFFDNQQPLPFHVHHPEDKARLVGKRGKPEAYYYPPQMNNHLGDQPIAYLGLRPDTTRAALRERLEAYSAGGDNRITDLSLGYRLRLGTGWDIPGGVLHAPPSLCTYEPQMASDVVCMCESWSNNREVAEALMWKDVPPEHHGDLDFVMSLFDWELNVDPAFAQNRFMQPYVTEGSKAQDGGAYAETWIVFRSAHFSAKELTVMPGETATVRDEGAYGAIIVQGRGRIGGLAVATTTMTRFGQMTEDEIFVSEAAALGGVRIANESTTEPLVLLKHFGPCNPELEDSVP